MKANLVLSILVTLAAITNTCDGAPIILSENKVAGNASPANLVTAGLLEGQAIYTDAPAIVLDVPYGLLGSDLVQVSSNDPGALIDVQIQQAGLLYVAIEDTQQQPLTWMNNTAFTDLPSGFINTGESIVLDSNADLVSDGSMSLWVALAPPGLYHLGTGTSEFNYSIFASHSLPGAQPIFVTEPNGFALAAVGAFCAFGMIRTAKGIS